MSASETPGALGQLGGAHAVVATLRERSGRQLEDALAALVTADAAARLGAPALRRSCFHVSPSVADNPGSDDTADDTY